MRFSERTPRDMTRNRIAEASTEAGRHGVVDLTESNPTRCGFAYPEPLIRRALGGAAALRYDPDPRGSLEARRAVSEHLRREGREVPAERLFLTASTSEAYSFLFKLLADPGDSILAPTPGYPLIDHLAALEGVRKLPYPLRKAPGWPVDRDALAAAAEEDTRAVVVIHPQNPTGTFLKPAEWGFLGRFCADRGLALVSDEVFSGYAYPGSEPLRAAPIPSSLLSFRMGGLSKSMGLPQLKLSWVSVDGPPAALDECLARLDLIADTYLSVNTPVQAALPALLNEAEGMRRQILERVLGNRGRLEAALGPLGDRARLWPAEGGWYALLELPRPAAAEEGIVLDLIARRRVLVQPGLFYDFSDACLLVLSLLPRPDVFAEGLSRLLPAL
ncbi:MAG: hypothetical protein A2X36_00970 [Elusimicrobia bacterium GWA2_69_24]|nr:MAG: hypothetical protein A2X36_00970 [Elusimicrobia bacterium GWA2_69_24]HBL17225.1 pyridoxal phosphate-dependent aminotransferase [Elusimicrobiota bacterium]